ncbi:hypothetical protein N7541_000386 [Penicillium brevicompactum]|uniref:F-box domain-containing protein n=1 Tax=Penicillium brevicompactum TaxID=5074 RepID=A0A9W9V4S7_PENBR|nr:hypothetical protein N7541_000386 [Penicillium brevicompactum]
MDPPQQPATPSKQLSTLDLGVTPTKRPRDTTVDSSSPASVFDDCPSSETFSIFGGSPPPRSTPSPLLQRQKSVTGRSLTAPPGKRAKRAGSSKKSKSLPFLPNELWDMIVDFLVDEKPREHVDIFHDNGHEEPQFQQTLSNMRLVCHAWNRAIAPHVFKRLSAIIGRTFNPLDVVFEASQTQWAPSVREFRLGVVGPWHPVKEYERYITNLVNGGLAVLLTRFPNLRTLQLQSPTVIAPYTPECQITGALLAGLTNSLVHSLRFVPLSNLRCLHLTLPVTAEFARFFKSDSFAIHFGELMSDLEELHLVINDDSGKDSFRDLYHPRSIVKARYPQQDYCVYFTNFIHYAKNVKILSIDTRAPLDVSNLDASSMTKLKSFRLARVEIRWETLRDIFQACKDTITRLEFEVVRLKSGTWADVFSLETTSLRNLEFFHCARGTYASKGESATFLGFTFIPGTAADLETLNREDWLKLSHIKWRVSRNRRAKNLEECVHTKYH